MATPDKSPWFFLFTIVIAQIGAATGAADVDIDYLLEIPHQKPVLPTCSPASIAE